jgi:hypothetical protein
MFSHLVLKNFNVSVSYVSLSEHCCEQARTKQHNPKDRHGKETVGNEFVAHHGPDLVARGWLIPADRFRASSRSGKMASRRRRDYFVNAVPAKSLHGFEILHTGPPTWKMAALNPNGRCTS